MNTALWIPLSLAAYAIFAVNGVIDKIVVSKKIKHPLEVSFWVSLTGTGSVVLLLGGLLPAPYAEAFRFHMPDLKGLGLIMIASLTLQFGLLLQYTALRRGEASRVISAIGATMPIFTLVFAFFLINERLSAVSYLAFVVLLAGAVTMLFRRGRWLGASFILAVSSAASMAVSSVFSKLVYSHYPIVSSLVLFGLCHNVYTLILLVISSRVRRALAGALHPRRRRTLKTVEHSGGALIVVNSVTGGLGAVALSLAISIGSVTLVNGLKGVQYAGIFLITLALSRFMPKLLKEELSGQTLRQKFAAISIIAVGLGLLTVTLQ